MFAGLFPVHQSEYVSLRSALEKLCLNDRSVVLKDDSSVALGQGWRIGFLGLLHMSVFTQRLEEVCASKEPLLSLHFLFSGIQCLSYCHYS